MLELLCETDDRTGREESSCGLHGKIPSLVCVLHCGYIAGGKGGGKVAIGGKKETSAKRENGRKAQETKDHDIAKGQRSRAQGLKQLRANMVAGRRLLK